MASPSVTTTMKSDVVWPRFANGRLLYADDLSALRAATGSSDRRLGRAVGVGVVEGLDAQFVGSKLRVSPGLAVAPNGSMIELANLVDLPVTRTATAPGRLTAATAFPGAFSDCEPGSILTYADRGPYVLLARTETYAEGQVPLQPKPCADADPGCTERWDREYVAFRLAAVPIGSIPGVRSDAVDKLTRNRVAHWFFGSDRERDLVDDPFSAQPPGRVNAGRMTEWFDNEVALAVIWWTGSGAAFLDRWPVRRRLVRPTALIGWTGLLDDRRSADGEARFLQFQDELSSVVDVKLVARDHFAWLPPAFIVPLRANALVGRFRVATDDLRKLVPLVRPVVFDQTVSKTISEALEAVKGHDDLEKVVVSRLAEQLVPPKAFGVRVPTDPLVVDPAEPTHVAVPLEDLLQRHLNFFQHLEQMSLKTVDDGIDLDTFLPPKSYRIRIIDHDEVDARIRRSWLDESVSTSEDRRFDVLIVDSTLSPGSVPYALVVRRPVDPVDQVDVSTEEVPASPWLIPPFLIGGIGEPIVTKPVVDIEIVKPVWSGPVVDPPHEHWNDLGMVVNPVINVQLDDVLNHSILFNPNG